MERSHQLPSEALAKRMLRDECLQLRHEIAVSTEIEPGIEAKLEPVETKLFEPRHFGLRELVIGEVGQRRTAPAIQSLVDPLDGDPWRGRQQRPRFIDQLLEAANVDPFGVDGQDVAGTARLDGRRQAFEGLSKVRDVALQSADRAGRRLAGPHVIGKTIDRHDFVRVCRQNGQHRPLTQTAEHPRAIVAHDLEGPQQSDLHFALLRPPNTPVASSKGTSGLPAVSRVLPNTRPHSDQRPKAIGARGR